MLNHLIVRQSVAQQDEQGSDQVYTSHEPSVTPASRWQLVLEILRLADMCSELRRRHACCSQLRSSRTGRLYRQAFLDSRRSLQQPSSSCYAVSRVEIRFLQ